MMVNAGSSESYGVEASFLASINKNLNMNVSYGYTHSTFKKYDGGTTSSEEQIDYSGNYVPVSYTHLDVYKRQILQARLLNQAHTELNVVIGLCVGHDSLFYKYSNAYTRCV